MKVNVNMENEVRTNPLVSIVVVTYNSSKYVLETLESVESSCTRILN
jgi:cellulose synthase/poly-beta-1,6-N-acetylglucosamine synthase-like glycosyltransferase